jgi:hypothetical protein
MERNSCSMPCLTKAWRRTLPNVACCAQLVGSKHLPPSKLVTWNAASKARKLAVRAVLPPRTSRSHVDEHRTHS